MHFMVPGYKEAAAIVAERIAVLRQTHLPTEKVLLRHAAGRVLSAPVCADRDQPPFTRSTRDGYACTASEAAVGSNLKVAGMTRAGAAPAGPILPGTVWEIMTGAPVPAGADAVVMLEHVEASDGYIRLLPERKIKAGENIVAQGSHGRTGEELLAAGAGIDAAQIALAASCGYGKLEVFARPLVAILTTGDELVDVEATPRAGQIRNSNAPMLAALVEASGGEARILPAAADKPKALHAALAQAINADLLVITGGVSAGKFDLVEAALEKTGAVFYFTGARIQPGKPTVFGERPRKGKANQLFFGLPGNPVSSAVTFSLFAAPVLAAIAGRKETQPKFALARMAAGATRSNKPGLTRFLPARCNFNAEEPQVSLVPWQGSGDLTALANSNCFLVVEEETGLPESGSVVRILLP